MQKHLLSLALLLPFPAYAQDCVILLHGLARSAGSLDKIEQALQPNYKTVNVDYPSTQHDIQILSQQYIPPALQQCASSGKTHFVTHSMGGLLLRQHLSHHKVENLGRVVMLGPPNQGSHVVDELKNIPGFETINGPAGMQIGTKAEDAPQQLPAANFELGIIAGTHSVNPLLSTLLPNPDDGKVSVEHTKLEGMQDHISLPVTHTFMMNNKKVIEQVLWFLKIGEFNHNEENTIASQPLGINQSSQHLKQRSFMANNTGVP